ncbi:hypothetical protein SNE40_004390 [Patella caerulea]|uniref:Cytochrome P450 n=1 Tax=Patella caerulea TaxID=87958 RepID=A0AAN8Q0T8_PATCE
MNILLIFVVLLGTYFIIKWFKDQQKTPLPPGPGLLECLKITWRMLRKNDIHLMSADLCRRYGEIFNIKIFSENIVMLNSSRVIRKVLLSSQYRDVTNDRPPTFVKKHIVYDGHDIVLRNFDLFHVKLRKIVHRSVKLYGDGVRVFEDMVKNETKNLQNHLETSNKTCIDLDRALTVSLLRVLHIFLTNEAPIDTKDVCETIEEYDHFINVIFKSSNNMVLTKFPWVRFVPGSLRQMWINTKNAQNRLNDLYLNPSIIKRMKSHGKGILGNILNEAVDDEEIDQDCIKGILSNMVVAGYLTTKGALSGFFLLMLYYPEIQRRIQEEIDEYIGRDRDPNLDDRSVMHYTNAAILECLRFIGHIPLGIPHMTREEIEVEGMRIPANATIICNLWMMSHSDQVWNNPDDFVPERFLDDSGKLLPIEHPLRVQFIPFGTGRRNCVGESFAKSRIFLYVTSLLQKFTFSPGENKLARLHPATWKPNAAMQPDFLNCCIQTR